MAYACEDKSTIQGMYQELLDRGIMPWMDAKDLRGGQRWRLFRDRALREADHCLLFLSTRSVKKIGEFQVEIRLAVEESRRRPEESNFLIPVKLDDCQTPDSLNEYHWI
jgi:hypothetical protein